MMDEVFGAIGKYKLGRNVLSFVEKIGDGISERFSKKFQPYFTKFIDSINPRDLKIKSQEKNDAFLLKPKAQTDFNALLLTTSIKEIKKSLSTRSNLPIQPSNQTSRASNKDNSRSK